MFSGRLLDSTKAACICKRYFETFGKMKWISTESASGAYLQDFSRCKTIPVRYVIMFYISNNGAFIVHFDRLYICAGSRVRCDSRIEKKISHFMLKSRVFSWLWCTLKPIIGHYTERKWDDVVPHTARTPWIKRSGKETIVSSISWS